MITITLAGTGCYAPGNPARAEIGQPEEEHEAETEREAIDILAHAAAMGRRGDAYDAHGDIFASSDGRRVRDADGDEIVRDWDDGDAG